MKGMQIIFDNTNVDRSSQAFRNEAINSSIAAILLVVLNNFITEIGVEVELNPTIHLLIPKRKIGRIILLLIVHYFALGRDNRGCAVRLPQFLRLPN